MKNLFYTTTAALLLLFSGACSKIDNYTAPSDTLQGTVLDIANDSTVQTEIGGGGIRVKLLETSYSSDPTPEYFQCKQDGTFYNDKVFSATYKVSVEGPFVPLVLTDASGSVVSDSSQTIDLKGSANLTFHVQPFLRVEWMGTPVLNADSTVTVKIRVTRGTSNPDYQGNITDINLYVSNTQYDGNNNYDTRYSRLTSYSGTDGNDQLGKVITITTTGGALPPQDIYFRVGARTDMGLKQFNYNAPLSIQ